MHGDPVLFDVQEDLAIDGVVDVFPLGPNTRFAFSTMEEEEEKGKSNEQQYPEKNLEGFPGVLEKRPQHVTAERYTLLENDSHKPHNKDLRFIF